MIEVTKKLGKMWKKVSDSEKAGYIAKADKAKAKYVVAMAKYKKTSSWAKHQEVVKEWKLKQAKKKFKKDPNAPKRAMSSYMLFVNETRPQYVKENPDLAVTEVLSGLGKLWADVSSSDKAAYEKKAAKLKEKYQKELEKYKKSSNYKKYTTEKEAYQASQKTARDKLTGKRERSATKSRSASRKSARKVKKAKRRSRRRSASKPRASKSRSASTSRSRSRSKSRSSKKRRRAAAPRGSK